MLVIRKAQMAALEQDVVTRFDESLAQHLRRFAPRESQALGNVGLLSVIRLGRQRAEEMAFSSRESIRLYVELMFLFGSGFSTDPQYPWATQNLAVAANAAHERERAAGLHSAAIDYLHKVLGVKREFAMMALKRLVAHRLCDFLETTPYPESVIQKLRVIFPEKCAYLGNAGLRTLIQSATLTAEQHGLLGAKAAVLLTILIFVMGHEADRDPISPWIEKMLRDTAFMESSVRIETLENKIWEEWRDGVGRFT